MPNNLSFLFAAFVVIWLLIFAYVAFIGGRVQGLRQDIALLREELAARGAAEAATPGGEAPAGRE
ncbi:MAG TPA: CcmD family protein [Thermomicrobiales bacterium]|nr:CcmD family protein [Thermomicrobiales bacterium]